MLSHSAVGCTVLECPFQGPQNRTISNDS
jgi:hypothetical protein